MLSSSNNDGFQRPEAPPPLLPPPATAAAAAVRTTMTTAATMEDKLHGVAASFRRERDEAHRRQWTAKERLRLVEQEAQAMAVTVESMEKDYKALQQKMGNEQELQTLMRDVELLTKEVGGSMRHCTCWCSVERHSSLGSSKKMEKLFRHCCDTF